jgi:hypothetical protein
MRASLKKSTSLSLAALTCAVLLFAAPFDAAMARGAGGSSGGASAGPGAGPGGSGGGPSVVKVAVITPDLLRRLPIRRRIVVVQKPHPGGCYVQAEQLEMELTDVEIDSFLNKCLSNQ